MTDHPGLDALREWGAEARRVGDEKDQRILALLDLVRDYENAITWGVACLNCSSLLDKLYEAEAQLEKCNGGHLVEAPPDENW